MIGISEPSARGPPHFPNSRSRTAAKLKRMKTLGVILARSDSTRLPGKALMDLGGGWRMIDLVLARAARSKEMAGVALATTSRPCDDELARHVAEDLGGDVFRGDLEDVAGRALTCAIERGAEWFVRINGDSPFVDASLLDAGIRLARESGADLVSNVLDRTYPYGIAVEVFRTETFQRVHESFDALEREHIARHFYQHPDRFRLVPLPPSPNPELAQVTLTLDQPEDLGVIGGIVCALGDRVVSADYETVAKLARTFRS